MRHLLAVFCLIATPAVAQEGPRVVADIAPVRALVAQVMQGVGTPTQIIPTGASPHGYAMRPSEARALREADVVVWVGPALTHWLEEPLDTLAGQADRLTLMAHPGTYTLPMREAVALGHGAEKAGSDDHGHEEHGHDAHAEEHGHDAHAEEHGHDAHAEGHGHDAHGDKEHGHDAADTADHGHDHGPTDPHGWLAPSNAVLWAGVIAQKLGEVDPANAELYTENWNMLREEVNALEAEISAQLEPYRDTSFIVLHDAFQYFEVTFGVQAQAFVVPGDGSTPGPARIKALREYLAQNPAVCAFTAPQENENLLRTVIQGQGTRVAVLDALGAGDVTYAELMRGFAADMVACLSKG